VSGTWGTWTCGGSEGEGGVEAEVEAETEVEEGEPLSLKRVFACLAV